MTPEGSFKKKVINDLGKLDRCWFRCIDSKAQRGIPDIIGCKNGMFFALELKASRTRAMKDRAGHRLQVYVIQKIKDTGSVAWITYPENWDKVYRSLVLI